MAYEPPTLADEGVDPAEPVRCECGRTVQAQMMVRIDGLPPGLTKKPDARHVCDGCRASWLRQGLVAAAEMARAFGAPADVIARAEGRRPR